MYTEGKPSKIVQLLMIYRGFTSDYTAPEMFQFVGLLQVYTSVYKVNTCSNPAVKHLITVGLLGSNLAAMKQSWQHSLGVHANKALFTFMACIVGVMRCIHQGFCTLVLFIAIVMPQIILLYTYTLNLSHTSAL